MESLNTLVKEKFNHASNRLVLLDYDGTLVNYESHPDNARPSEQLCNMITQLASQPRTRLIIISGRAFGDMDKLIGKLPVDIIAEHGAFTRENGKWRNNVKDKPDWKKFVLPVFIQHTTACPGTFLEEKSYTLTWHYRNAETAKGYACSRALLGLLDGIAHANKLKILDGNMVIEVMGEETGKGKVVKKMIEECSYDFILSIGDDRTDEEMFEFLRPMAEALTIKVGIGNSCAKFRLPEVKDVLTVLNSLIP